MMLPPPCPETRPSFLQVVVVHSLPPNQHRHLVNSSTIVAKAETEVMTVRLGRYAVFLLVALEFILLLCVFDVFMTC
jgi:hypothetical protein